MPRVQYAKHIYISKDEKIFLKLWVNIIQLMYLMRFLIDRKYPFIFLFNSIEVSVSVLAAQDLCFSLLKNHIPQKEIWFFLGKSHLTETLKRSSPWSFPPSPSSSLALCSLSQEKRMQERVGRNPLSRVTHPIIPPPQFAGKKRFGKHLVGKSISRQMFYLDSPILDWMVVWIQHPCLVSIKSWQLREQRISDF